MKDHFKLSDTQFEQAFRLCQLDPTLFTHEAHLRLAYIHIRNYGLDQAEKNIQEQLQKFVAFVGAKDKYNTTLTLAAVKAVFHFMGRSSKDNFRDFMAEFPRLKYNFKALMDAHYGFDIYRSQRAKTEFLEPDLLPFD